MATAIHNPLATEPEAVTLFCQRVEARDWRRARRLAYVLGLHHDIPQKLMEHDQVWLRRVCRKMTKALRDLAA